MLWLVDFEGEVGSHLWRKVKVADIDVNEFMPGVYTVYVTS
jgi:hypothetical protein